MSLIDRALQDHTTAAELRLSPEEAFAAILVAAVSADGQFAAAESTRLGGLLSTSRVLPPNPPDGSANVIERALALLTDNGLPAVLKACAAALPEVLRATAFAQAVDLILADGRLPEGEKSFIDDLQGALHLDEALALRIVDVLLIKNRG